MITYKGNKVHRATLEVVRKHEGQQVIRITTAHKTYYFSIPITISVDLREKAFAAWLGVQ